MLRIAFTPSLLRVCCCNITHKLLDNFKSFHEAPDKCTAAADAAFYDRPTLHCFTPYTAAAAVIIIQLSLIQVWLLQHYPQADRQPQACLRTASLTLHVAAAAAAAVTSPSFTATGVAAAISPHKLIDNVKLFHKPPHSPCTTAAAAAAAAATTAIFTAAAAAAA
jgi:hypothetical protein